MQTHTHTHTHTRPTTGKRGAARPSLSDGNIPPAVSVSAGRSDRSISPPKEGKCVGVGVCVPQQVVPDAAECVDFFADFDNNTSLFPPQTQTHTHTHQTHLSAADTGKGDQISDAYKHTHTRLNGNDLSVDLSLPVSQSTHPYRHGRIICSTSRITITISSRISVIISIGFYSFT